MHLLVVSYTAHHLRAGRPVGWGPTVREIDHLAGLFRRVTHVAPLYTGEAPPSALPYSAPNVAFHAVAPGGGNTILDRLLLLPKLPGYALTVFRHMRRADVIHLRCPASLSMIGAVLLPFVKSGSKRWIKYAGDWGGGAREPLASRFQRWWLRGTLHRGVVTVNGTWPGEPDHIRPFLNPCLTDEELERAAVRAGAKSLTSPLRLLLVGRVESAKGVGIALEIVRRLHTLDVNATLDIVGDGEERGIFEQEAAAKGIARLVRFRGWLPRAEIARFYSDAHILLLPSATEGWPKVLSEGMAHGVVPLATAVSSIPEFFARFGAGRCHERHDVDAFVESIAWYARHPLEWRRESGRGVQAAAQFTYSNYLSAVRSLLALEDRRTQTRAAAAANVELG